jgi:hypothetical protein
VKGCLFPRAHHGDESCEKGKGKKEKGKKEKGKRKKEKGKQT